MKICPVCNDSFADQLNFCDIDGTRLRRAGSANERNKWWSLLGAGLLVAALVITAASIFFLPKARSTPIVNSEPQSIPAPSKEASAGDSATVAAAPPVSVEPETVPTVSVLPEVKKKDKALDDENATRAAPNPKAAALAAEETDKKSTPIEVKDAAPASKKSEPTSGSADDARSVEIPAKTQPPDLKKETKASTPVAKDSDKGNDKKKNDEKDKKKGGFLRVFKKIFGKN
jgi:hypothetical protein